MMTTHLHIRISSSSDAHLIYLITLCWTQILPLNKENQMCKSGNNNQKDNSKQFNVTSCLICGGLGKPITWCNFYNFLYVVYISYIYSTVQKI